jgi:transposase InsO family protein
MFFAFRRWIMAKEQDEPIQRWTAKRQVVLVLSIAKSETSVAEAARAHGLTVAEIEEWRDRFLIGAENALRARPKDKDALKEECVWQHGFGTFDEANQDIRAWMQWYNKKRPHQALGYQSPCQYRQKERSRVA